MAGWLSARGAFCSCEQPEAPSKSRPDAGANRLNQERDEFMLNLPSVVTELRSMDLHERPELAAQHLQALERRGTVEGHQVLQLGEQRRRLRARQQRARRLDH